MTLQSNVSVEDRISTILAEFAQTAAENLPYDPSLSLQNSLGLESLTLVSVILRMGDEFEVDVTDFVVELNALATVGDLYSLAHKLQCAQPSSS